MINFNKEGLENEFKPSANESRGYLNSAKDTIRSIDIPSDFTYRSRLNNLPQDIVSINDTIKDILSEVDKSIANFSKAENEINNKIGDILNSISKLNILFTKNETVKDTTENTNTYYSNGFFENLIEEGKQKANKIVNGVTQIIKILIERTGASSSSWIQSIYKNLFEDSLPSVNCYISDKQGTENSIFDDPQIKQDLEMLNGLLEVQRTDLIENAEETKNKLSNDYNPVIKLFMENFSGSFENPSDISRMIFILEDQLYRLEQLNPDGSNYSNEARKLAYDLETENNLIYISFSEELTYSEEDWKLMQEYLRQNNLKWNNIIHEYEEIINILTVYKEDLENKKSQIYNLERYIELYPYTKITQKDDFEEYLERDYSEENYGNWFSYFFSMLLFRNPNEEGRLEELTQEEKAIYYYIKENYSKREAEEYYESLEDLINQRKGQKEAFEYIESLELNDINADDGLKNFLITTGMGFKDGVWTFGENISNLFPGNGEVMSDTQYKQAFLMAMLTQEINLTEIEKQYGKNSDEYKIYDKVSNLQSVYKQALGINYNVAAQIGELAVPMVVSMVPQVGGTLGIVLEGLSDAGSVKAMAYQNGITGWEAYLYMGIQGITSAVLTKAFGAIPGLSDNVSIELKKILKGATQSGISAVAQSKIDLFVTKVFTGETIELEEFFDIEEDAMIFATAVCTALILNGGNALKIRIDGEETTISTKDIQDCVKEDGTLDEAKVNLLIGKMIGIRDTNHSIDFKLNESKNAVYKICNGDIGQLYNITKSDIDKIFNSKIKILSKSMFEAERNKRGLVKNALAFYSPSEDMVYLAEDNSSFVITHEVMHALGNANTGGKDYKDYIEINEAFTDYFANKFLESYSRSAYTENAESLENIIKALEKNGYKGIAEQAYFGKDGKTFEDLIDSLSYKGFYKKLAKEMYVAVNGSNSEERKKAQSNVKKYEKEFINTVSYSQSDDTVSFSQLDKVVEIMNQKGYNGINRLKNYIKTGKATYITREGNARTIVTSMSKDTIERYLKQVQGG